MSGNIYDDLASSDFVNPGQFKAQMKALAEIEDTDKGPERDARHSSPGKQQDMAHGDVELPGPMYARQQ